MNFAIRKTEDRMRHPAARQLTTLASLLLAAAIPAIAPHRSAAQPPAPASSTLKVTTRLTQVDITATDLNGHPVHGLTQSDFTVKEDGKPQPIKNFDEVTADMPVSPVVSPKLPSNVYTNAYAQPATAEAINVLLIDDVGTGTKLRMRPELVAYSRTEVTRYLHSMPAGKQVILLELSDQLRVIQGLTSDRDVLLEAVRPIFYRQDSRTSLPPCSPPEPCIIPPIVGCQVANAQSEAVVHGLESIAAYLTGIRGRKNLIWFTPGIPWLTNFRAWDHIRCLLDYTAELQRDYNLLAAAQAALYPIDPGGIKAPRGGGASIPDPREHISLEDLADATGGQAFYDTNDLAAAIGHAVAAGTDYYSLSYVPPLEKYDGQYHKISISVNRPGVHLVYRKGYTSLDPANTPSPAQEASDKTPPPADAPLYTAMAHGAPPSTQLLFTVAITPTTPPTHPGDPIVGQLNPSLKLKGKPLTRYDFNYRVLPGDITLTEAPGGKRQASVEFTAAAYDGTGEMLNILRQTVSFEVAPAKLAAFLARPLPVLLQLDLPPGPIFLRAAIRDIPSNKLGTLEIPLTVPK
jgi:VWFA-related protein